ncbi:hypothetical protein CI109_100988 [Kwoniella shandongensis]|uniref:Uncharacterized protein n=1 Tax=Kwoniella shandongensis TaxID=1734106 RepID=A0A5M6C4Y9_9TREE|nr:uncharacterized protein CI109_001456 [Kwoniella shandongensis]KAA5530053.1 hypothetical protein CI109_001456 [Kwoniella shandongensis]
MANFTSATTSNPSPTLLLEALRAHLLPTPIFPLFTETLNIFAHFQLLSARLKEEARRALTMHNDLLAEYDETGLSNDDIVEMGSLTVQEGVTVERISKRDEGDLMSAFSLGFRKYYFAYLLSTPGLTPMALTNIRTILNSYLPDLSSPTTKSKTLPLFISCMPPDQESVSMHYRDTVLAWCERVESAIATGAAPMKFESFYPNEKARGIRKRATLNIFEDTDGSESVKEEEDLSEADDDGRQHEGFASTSRRRHTLAITGPTPVQRHTNATPFGSIAHQSASRPRALLPVAGPSRHLSSNEGADSIDLTDFHNTLPVRQSTADLRDRRKTTSFTPTKLGTSALHAPPLRSSETQDASSTRSKKRPRQSFPPAGPDYTVRAKEFGENVDRRKLQPFDNDELYKSKKSRLP